MRNMKTLVGLQRIIIKYRMASLEEKKEEVTKNTFVLRPV
jgi:hypothetical protein